MIGAARRWLRRNRRGLAIGAGIIGLGYVAGQYVLSKFSEARERMNSDRIAKENLRRRFEQNQADCTFTVLALLPTATENILEALPVEELTQELQRKRAERLARASGSDVLTSEPSSSTAPSVVEEDGKSLTSFQADSYIHASQVADSTTSDPERPRRTKAQLWNDVKIYSITRSIVLIYTLSLLTILTRIQLNLLGRRSYLSSVLALASPEGSSIRLEDHDDMQAFGNDFETNRRYLTFSWWLLNRGWKDLMENVRAAVEEVFGPLNPREDITLNKLSELILDVRKRVEGATEEDRRAKQWLPYLLPPKEDEDTVLQESGVLSSDTPSSPQTAANLRQLLDETSDLIESPSFSRILTSLNNEGFAKLIEQKCANSLFNKTPTSEPTPITTFSSAATIVPSSSPKAKLATVLALITRESHIIGNGTNPPNEYLVAMEQGVQELEAFAAVIYSSNFHLGLLESENAVAAAAKIQEENQPGLRSADVASAEQSIASKQEQETSSVTDDNAFEKVWGKAVERSGSGDEA
ncbi:peroxisomal membrane protein (Pex3), putative [Talaromyces stipitatus ATCC 10500]|uniref:Peroxisomal membrane protein (Pex3), putative n=1 Tax=Talaromyces stipitatus (strain ATCC 10500 / CBS 375.48 / QM 6759 / NRRL 1006) TaxID=441959 RepID=B8MBU4_TALSN|nr:peroxisomal membrane protein (Pex3), putative [Talaromyces stipitatus ATCC 10500]EED18227.1 peroxisomal membrane protein (Pex3), putative [Talaromyces stipitatus ATCC 10500]